MTAYVLAQINIHDRSRYETMNLAYGIFAKYQGNFQCR